MGAIRKSTLFSVDAGRFVDFNENITAIGVDSIHSAKRYTSISEFINSDADKNWNVNSFGDNQKRLVDNKYGYRIRESIFTSEKDFGFADNRSSLSPSSRLEEDILNRSSVMYSLAQGQYLYIDPASMGGTPGSINFAYVSSANQATRFTNVLPFATLLETTVLGDDPYGWLIEQYVFTKPPLLGPTKGFFQGLADGSRSIERAFVPFSTGRGAWLWIDPTTINNPPAEMIFNFTDSVWEGARFTDTTRIQEILDATEYGQDIYGFDLPQYYFNRDANPITQTPFDIFWGEFGPYKCLGEVVVRTWLDSSIKGRSWNDFMMYANGFLLTSGCYPNPKAFNSWWSIQDNKAYEQWLLAVFVDGGGEIGGEFEEAPF
jgi:hypothetical protein